MLTPPTLLTLVHAVQQPIGRPAFAALDVDHTDVPGRVLPQLQTAVRGRTDPRSWRLSPPGAGWRDRRVSDGRLHLTARARPRWTSAPTGSIRSTCPTEPGRRAGSTRRSMSCRSRDRAKGISSRAGPMKRRVGYYDPEHDQIAMVRSGDHRGPARATENTFIDAAPRHDIGDTKRHLVPTRRSPPRAIASTSRRTKASTSRDERPGARGRAGLGAASRPRRRLRDPDVRLAAADRDEHEAQRPLRRRPPRLPGTRLVLVRRRRTARRGALERRERRR